MAARLRWVATSSASGVLLALAFAFYGLMLAHGTDLLGFDLHVFWRAAGAVGHGNSPYDAAALHHARVLESQNMHAEPDAPWAVYPPALFVALAPLGYLPWSVVLAIGLPLLAAAPACALWIMGVRDWRCYALVFLSLPVFTSIDLGTLSTALMVGYALLWRGRRTILAGSAIIVAKLFLWPAVIVVAAIDGVRRAAILVAVACAAALASWAVIGFAGITTYPELLGDLSAIEAHNSFSMIGLAYALGLPLVVGMVFGIASGLVVCAFAYRAGRAGRVDAAYTLALAASLLMSPIIWQHYLVLLFLPIAARKPRLHLLWFVPLATWSHGAQGTHGQLRPALVFWACIGTVVLSCVVPGSTSVRRVVQGLIPSRGLGRTALR